MPDLKNISTKIKILSDVLVKDYDWQVREHNRDNPVSLTQGNFWVNLWGDGEWYLYRKNTNEREITQTPSSYGWEEIGYGKQFSPPNKIAERIKTYLKRNKRWLNCDAYEEE